MITEKDLMEAIAECQGDRNPDANTCIKLAAFYTIRREMYGTAEPMPTYSYAEPPVSYDSDSEFMSEIRDKNLDSVLPVIDELMDTLKVMMPRLYDGVMKKIREG